MSERDGGQIRLLTGAESVQNLAGGPGLGLDRLSLVFPLVREPGHPELSRTEPAQLPGHLERGPAAYRGAVPVEWAEDARGARVPLVSVWVSAACLGGEWYGKVEANPSRLLDPEGCSVAPLESLHDCAERMVTAGSELVSPRVDWDEARVSRVDVARRFHGVRSPGFYVRGLLNIKRPYARRSYVYADPARLSAETLAVGSGAGMVRLYDEHAAHAAQGSPEGSLRWEVEARGDWLARGARELTVGRLDAVRLRRLAEQRWEWSGMWREVRATVDVVEAVERLVCRHPRGERGRRVCGCDGLTRAVADRLLGQMVREALSVAGRQSRTTDADYESLKRRLGIVPSADLFAGGTTVSVAGRLDWESGTELAA